MIDKKFAVRDMNRILIAFGIIILVLNFNYNIVVYLFGIITLLIGFLSLFSLKLKIKLAGAVDMALVGVYFIIFALLLYPRKFGSIGNLIILVLGLLLLILGVRFILQYRQSEGQIKF